MSQHTAESHRRKRQAPFSTHVLAAVLSVLGLQVAAADELKPFEARYAWIWHGMTVADSTLKLEKTGDTWTYSSKSEPRGIGNLLSERPHSAACCGSPTPAHNP